MSDVFISYAREDRDKAERLARACEQQKWVVWWDKVIPPGKKYADVIGQELKSAKAVVVLWSSASVASDWVKDEAQEAAKLGILVPALIEKVDPPYGFRQVQTADLSDWDGSSTHAELQRFVHAIGSLLNQPVLDPPNARDDANANTGKLPIPLYIVAGAVLVLILGFAAYSFFSGRGAESNQNQIDAGNRAKTNENQTTASAKNCGIESRRSAADLTGKGLMMIDPGGNQAAAVLQFNQAITECPDYADAYFWRAQSFVALQQLERAIADLKKVVELTNDADTRQKAEKFLADIERPHPTTPGNENTNTTNTNNSNANATNVRHIDEMFSADRSTRIAATTRLIIDKKQDSAAVRMSVKKALENPQNKSGVINTLVYLESVAPSILKQNRVEIEKLLAVARDNGSQTADHIRKVRDLLNN